MFNQALTGENGLWWAVLLAVAAAAVAYTAASLIARLASVAIRSAVRRRGLDANAPEVRRPVRIVRWATFAVFVPLLCLPAIRQAGIDLRFGLSPQALSNWIFGSGLRIGVIVLASYVLTRIIALVSRELEEQVTHAKGPDVVDRAKRARTIGHLVRNAATVAVVVLATLMVLREVHVDITPILTGAGILGLAVGFGGQALVRDLISGFFLILENQIRVGDVVIINGTGGLVEEINLRTVILRDGDGTVHVFPNGSITQLANRSKDFSYYTADIGVSYRNDLDQVATVLRQVGESLMTDEAYRSLIVAPVELVGVEALRENQVVMRVRIRTLPLKQWDVGREFLRRVKAAFERAGIELPSPHAAINVARRDAAQPS
jgi:small-conductance mechanosensitive channel